MSDEEKTHADLPKVDVEFAIDVPEGIEELARDRFETAQEEGNVPDGITLEDYVADHIRVSWDLQFEE